MRMALNILNLRRLKRRLIGCLLWIGLGLLLACSLFGFLLGKALAQEPAEAPWELLVLVDNSNSMFERSDPEQLRMAAARLFINYLGVDRSGPAHRLGIIFFGGEAQLIAPLTPLADEIRRAELASLLENPQPLRWTNPEAALALAEQALTGATTTRKAVVLLTDGKPEWGAAPTESEKAATLARLRTQAGRFADRGIPLFIILLQSETAQTDPEIEQLYGPLWQAMATPPGRFFRVQQGEELLGIYHDIVVALTGRRSDGVVVETQVHSQMVETIDIEPGLAQVTLIIRKSEPTLQVQIIRPDGQKLKPNLSGVQYAGQPETSLEEIWAISDPAPGPWQVHLNGQGVVKVWKDYYPATPTPSPLPTFTATPIFTAVPSKPTPPPATPSSSPTHTPTPTSTATPIALPLPPPTTASPSAFSPFPLFLLGLSLLAVGGGGWYWFRLRQARPKLSGDWYTQETPAGAAVPVQLELDRLQRQELTVGGRPADDIHLPALATGPSPPSVRLKAEIEPDGLPGVSLAPETGVGLIRLNNLPLAGPRFLRDGDTVTLGAYRFKYENLRRRRAWQGKR